LSVPSIGITNEYNRTICETSNHTTERRIVVIVWTQESGETTNQVRDDFQQPFGLKALQKQPAIPAMGASQELEGYQPKDSSSKWSSTLLPGYH
jgi:hypothetical protein